MKQIVKEPKKDETKEDKESETAEKRKRGRPKGRKNKNSKATVELEKLFLLVFTFLQIIKSHLKLPNLRYFVYDGAFGNNVGVHATKNTGFHLISKLKRNSMLYFQFDGEQKEYGCIMSKIDNALMI